MSDPVVWHRPEYQDRGDQLVSLAQVAELAGVTRAAVSNWRRRHNFPAPAMTAGRTVWVVCSEVAAWLDTERPKATRGPSDAAKAKRAAKTVATLEAREQRQAVALAATRKKLRGLRQQLTTHSA
ncbi:helix-turn-helix transcriptional regulator [Actinacidiphila glaucinigra]|uniref:helix-turn-helix transcriptional regulator n=1 Tax=Actinacidiphila glaucinigra TaxID=235986 RepID=UPI0035D96501